MNKNSEYQTDEKELYIAEELFNNAKKQRVQLNKEHRELLSIYYDKIAIYSASAISFTITIIGLALSNNAVKLQNEYLFTIPVIYLLYSTWIFFGLAFILATFSRKLDALYIHILGKQIVSDEGAKLEKIRSDFAKKYPNMVSLGENDDDVSVLEWADEKNGISKQASALAKKFS
jgi:hypothetical protein